MNIRTWGPLLGGPVVALLCSLAPSSAFAQTPVPAGQGPMVVERVKSGFVFAPDVKVTEFDRRVWELIAGVPYGETTTYGDLARGLGAGTDPRDVGAAVGRNPLCIVIPCHRVIGSTGKLTGYAGGLDRKRTLLEIEHAHALLAGHASAAGLSKVSG